MVLLAIPAVGASQAHAATAHAATAHTHKRVKPMYWGAWIGSHLTGTQAPWDMRAVTAFERRMGKGVSLLNFSSPFSDCTSTPCRPYPFPAHQFDRIRAHGTIPFFSWNSASLHVTVDQPDFRLGQVTAGRYDAYIRQWAKAAKHWGHPFFLRFNWEMNGDWFPWAEAANGNRPGEYVAAWRHVHDIFRRVGATNVAWVWCPNVDMDGSMTPLAGLYPGDAYVDWTALDGYNANDPWRSFTTIFGRTYDVVTRRIAPHKPMLIAETASTEQGGSKAQWITDMFAALPKRFPKVRGLLWFDKSDDGTDWWAESSPSAQAALARGVAARAYRGNVYRGAARSAMLRP